MNPFNVFNIEPEFKIDELDDKYYQLYKTCQDKSLINEAYEILKDDIKRAKNLCEINNQTQASPNIAKEMFALINKTYEEKTQLLNESKEKIIENACAENWGLTWHYLQKYSYIKRMIN